MKLLIPVTIFCLTAPLASPAAADHRPTVVPTKIVDMRGLKNKQVIVEKEESVRALIKIRLSDTGGRTEKRDRKWRQSDRMPISSASRNGFSAGICSLDQLYEHRRYWSLPR